MRMRRCETATAAMGAALAMLVGPAQGANATGSPSPACQGRDIPVQAGERLVEHTAYFHGVNPNGNADGAQETAEGAALGSPAVHRLVMDATAPSTDADKVYVSNVDTVAGGWDPDYAMNMGLGYSYLALAAPARLVCAEATVYANSTSGLVSLQLWIDANTDGSGDRVAEVSASGPPGTTAPHVANFGPLVDVVPKHNVVVQLDPADRNSPFLYDSTSHPSKLVYVTVEPA